MNRYKKIIFFFIIISCSYHGLTAFTFPKANFIEYDFNFSDDERLKQVKDLLETNKTEEAIQKLYQLIAEAEKLKDTNLIIEGSLLLADVYRDNGDYKSSNKQFYKLLPLIKENNNYLQILYFKKGGNFQKEGEIDSAMVNYKNALFYSNFFNNNEDLKAKINANLAGIYYLKEDYGKAIEHSKIAANYQKILGNIEIEAGILNNLGSIYFMQGNYKEALNVFQQTFKLVGFGQEDLQKQIRRSSYINSAYAYSGLKQFQKAFEYQDKYISLDDSIKQELKYKEIAEIESKFKVASKEKEAEIEKSKRLEAEYLSYGLGFSICILLILLFVLYKMYKLNKKNYTLKIDQKRLMHQSKIEKLKSDSQTKILAATLDGRLEERKVIASVLHDNVSALLSAANLHLFASKKQLKDQVPVEINKSQKILNEASESIRDLSHRLVPSLLLKFGLSIAVQDLCEKSSNSTIEFSCDTKNITRFDQNFELKIFNIISELVNNILKHSNANNATIKLEQLEGQLQLVIFDNGKGFDLNEINDGVGLSQVKARINVLEGIIKIKSSTEGTRIYISTPIVY
ncbi:tetratricopeptide repeat protein [Lutibacter aestuarii]|uniref:histidine kinase n=1 Tax=Lutibacter aestuarii TaxID=861111 RepID=A0ABW2Z397_9FLAO|nr:tetratricopeptide repeat-containing sensor histidine kinase [uncultured Lutibacter sp.]